MTITTGSHSAAVWPGIHSWFGAVYDEYKPLWPEMFDQEDSNQNYERVAVHGPLGLMPEKSEGGSVTYVDHSQLWTQDFVHVAYALGWVISFEAQRDNLYEKIARDRSAALAFSARQTQEIVLANIYNRADNASYTWGDGKEILATDHPLANGSTFSNELNPAADFSETAFEDLLIQMMGCVDDEGNIIQCLPRTLIYPRQLKYEVIRVLDSVLQNDTANNAVNAVKADGTTLNRVCNPYLTDVDKWFIRSNDRDGMVVFARDYFPKPLFKMDNDTDTMNKKAFMYMRFKGGSRNPRGLWGSVGA